MKYLFAISGSALIDLKRVIKLVKRNEGKLRSSEHDGESLATTSNDKSDEVVTTVSLGEAAGCDVP